ncbi:hypothetical protein Pve01_64870 [Planomonospora venezuelensis]|nr:hypothetical protein Pve01_64870 [Planomonospora venezuelensis]
MSTPLNLMFTQRPDGDLVIGDTHAYATTPDPFGSDELDRHVLAETARLLGAGPLAVRERWRGVYASAPEPFLVNQSIKLFRFGEMITHLAVAMVLVVAVDRLSAHVRRRIGA